MHTNNILTCAEGQEGLSKEKKKAKTRKLLSIPLYHRNSKRGWLGSPVPESGCGSRFSECGSWILSRWSHQFWWIYSRFADSDLRTLSHGWLTLIQAHKRHWKGQSCHQCYLLSAGWKTRLSLLLPTHPEPNPKPHSESSPKHPHQLRHFRTTSRKSYWHGDLGILETLYMTEFGVCLVSAGTGQY